MSEIALQFSGVVKSYGRTQALRDVSFDVAEGEFFGLVGVNGAGKTTLLKCLLDFCNLSAGTIQIFGTPHHLTVARRRLAFLPERFNPPYYLTGEDFIRYVLGMQSTPYDRAEAEHMLRAFDLDLSALKLPVRAYSKGMTQKLGLAACLLSRKDLYILDEPASGLDPKAHALLKARLQELKRQSCTVFFTSHALADVAELSDRIAVIHAGSLRFAGTPAALCEQHGGKTLEQAFLNCIDDIAQTA
ncbi:MAG: transporter family protein [Betaproteobacteria bacterium]|nr:transporter family protein [Betaproteobacteria bacterium]